MYRFISPQGEIIKTKTIREFASKHNFPYSMARSLACGSRARLRGWCSTSKRAKKHRERFMTRLTNMRTGETAILGGSVKRFAGDHGLSLQGLSELVNYRVPIYRYWVLQGTLEAVNVHTPADFF